MKAVIGMLVTIAISVVVAIYFLCFESEEQVINKEKADVIIMITITIMIIHNMNSIIAHTRINQSATTLIQHCTIITLRKKCSDPVGEDADVHQ